MRLYKINMSSKSKKSSPAYSVKTDSSLKNSSPLNQAPPSLKQFLINPKKLGWD